MDTWLVLKAITRSGYIQDWNKQKAEILQLCKCSETIFRLRLRWLSKKNFLCLEGKSIRISAYNTVAKILNIDLNKKFIIQYDSTSKQRVQEWLIATEITDNQQRQDYMILKRVNKNPHFNMQLTAAMIKDGADCNQLADADYFLHHMRSLYLADFVVASDIHDLLIDVRPDNNRGIKAMKKAWNTRATQTVCYWKKILSSVGIIDIQKRKIQSCERVRNKYCKVLWSKADAETVLVLSDDITVMRPWLYKNFLVA